MVKGDAGLVVSRVLPSFDDFSVSDWAGFVEVNIEPVLN